MEMNARGNIIDGLTLNRTKKLLEIASSGAEKGLWGDGEGQSNQCTI
jgi:hypothetical protein